MVCQQQTKQKVVIVCEVKSAVTNKTLDKRHFGASHVNETLHKITDITQTHYTTPDQGKLQ